MLNFQSIFNKLKFFWEKPKVVIVVGGGRRTAREAIFQVLQQHFKTSREILILETGLAKPRDIAKFGFLLQQSSLPIIVVTHIGDIPFDKDFFAADIDGVKEITKLIGILPAHGRLILNFDDETVRELKTKSQAHPLTFGFQQGADFRASDCNITETPERGTNFKINHKGNIVPVWLRDLLGKEQIYAGLASSAVGQVLGLNLVEVSGALKSYQSLPGKMRMIEGMKNSWILDDSESASLFSMIEALEILGKIKAKRKIAVLGDVMGIGRYTIEAHEAIGEKAAVFSNLLFTVGSRAGFIAEGAKNRGVSENKIFQFDTAELVAKALQDEIKEGDLILVDGSKEMNMAEIVKEIKSENFS